jgi:RNA polymerase sigma factor (sigma-70 family)
MQLTATVRAAQQGDAHAFADLVRTHATLVCSLATAVTGDRATGEEVGQQVFVTAWQKLPTLANPDTFVGWLRQITRRRALDARRRRQARPQPGPTDPDQLSDPTADLGDRLDAHRREVAMWTALESLDTDHREVLLLFYREGRRVRHVAELLELSEATVRKRLSRAREALRGATEDELAGHLTRTAPGSAFLAAVAAALAAGSPGVAHAGTAAAGAKVLGAGAAVGASAGLLGVWLGYRQAAPTLSAADRGRLRRHALAQATSIGLGALCMSALPPVVGTLLGMTVVTVGLAGTLVRWPPHAGRLGGLLVGLLAGVLGASAGLASQGLSFPTALALHLQLLAFVALPLVAVSAASWHLQVRARWAAAGAGSWLLAAPVLAAGPVAAGVWLGDAPWVPGLGLSLAAGIGEELARAGVLLVLWRLVGPVDGRRGVLLGLGHGGLEAVLFGLGALGALAAGPPMDAASHALYGASRVLLLLGHVGFALGVWRAVSRRSPAWLLGAIVAHVALDLGAFVGPVLWPVAGMWLAGALIVIWAGVSAWLVRQTVSPTV